MVSKSDFEAAIQYCFPGEELIILLFNFLKDAYEEIMGRRQKNEIIC